MWVVCPGWLSRWVEQTRQKGRSAGQHSRAFVDRGKMEWWFHYPGSPSAAGPYRRDQSRNWIRNQKVQSVLCPILRKLCGHRQDTSALWVCFLICKLKKSLIFLLTESWHIYSIKPQNKANPLWGVLSQDTTLSDKLGSFFIFSKENSSCQN